MVAVGYMEISNSIPKFKKALFKNQVSLKYHVQIPLEYWEWKYPNWPTMKTEEQEQILDDFYNELNDCLTGADNAQKMIMTFYRSKTNGAEREMGQFKIDVIDDKMKNMCSGPWKSGAGAVAVNETPWS